MKRTTLLLLLLLSTITLSAQRDFGFVYKAGVNTFFDNLEYSGSTVKESQTMAGVHLKPEIGMHWKNRHMIYAGVDLMHEYGSDRVVDYTSLLAYYQFDAKPFRFYAGAFPRRETLDRYPLMFFSDSVNNYRPSLTGFFWEYYKNEKTYANLWLDWTSRQTTERHETFFMGWSGRYQYRLFYVQHFGYMYHYAEVKDPAVYHGVNDNGLILTSLGLDFSERTGFEALSLDAGWSVGLERQRIADEGWRRPMCIYSELNVEYRGLGLKNAFYYGEPQQQFYATLQGNPLPGNNLYWGDAVYRAPMNNVTDIYINFFKSKTVNVRLTVRLTAAEGRLYNEQLLYASFNFDNRKKEGDTRFGFIWDKWFEK